MKEDIHHYYLPLLVDYSSNSTFIMIYQRYKGTIPVNKLNILQKRQDSCPNSLHSCT